MSKYPEHDKYDKVKDECHAIGEFLEWAEARGIRLAKADPDRLFELVPIRASTDALLAGFYNIDLKALEIEKSQMLEEFRKTS